MMYRLHLRLDWSDMDMFGHINNISYFKFLQSSRVHCWEVTGLSALFKTQNQGPVLLSTSCKFLKPLHYPGDIRVESAISFIGNTSFGIKHTVFDGNEEISAEGEDVLVMFDFEKNEKLPVPDFMRKAWQNVG